MPLTQIVQVGGGAAQDTNNDGSVQGGSAAFGQDNVSGNTIIVLGGVSPPKTVSTPAGLAVSDTQGNTYNVAIFAGALGTDGVSCQISYANGIKAGPNTVHVVGPNAAGWGYAYTIIELDGKWTPNAGATGGDWNSIGTGASPAINTSVPGCLLFSYVYDNAPHNAPLTANWMLLHAAAQVNQDDPNVASGGGSSFGNFAAVAGEYALVCTWPDIFFDQGIWTGTAFGQKFGATIAMAAFQFTPGVSGGGPGGSLDVITDLCRRAGVPAANIDTSLLLVTGNIQPTNVVKGYLINQQASAAQIIKVLMDAYFFGGCESDGIMKWVPRGLAVAMTIPEADLGLEADKAKMLPQVADAQTLPQRVIVTYNDPAINYQQQKQQSQRNSRLIQIKQQVKLDFPLTLDPDFAKQLSEKALYLAWQERTAYKLNLFRPEYLRIDPTDVIDFVYEGITFRMRIAENTIGQGFVLALNGPSEDARIYISSAQGGISFVPPPPPPSVVGFTLLFLFDIPLLRDTDSSVGNTGLYAALTSQTPSWAGAELDISSDNSLFTKIGQSTLAATYGVAQSTLGAPRSPWTWDDVNTLTIKISKGALAGDSELNVLNGANPLIVGGEIIQFVNATTNVDGTVTVSRLLRGRRGTEQFCGTHAANESVVAPLSGIIHVTEPLAIKGLLRYYKAVTSGQDPTTVPSQQFTNNAIDLKPYAPCHIEGDRDGSNNLTINWTRRTRVGGAWLNGTGTVPLSEDAELYQVDIVSGMTVLRTLTGLWAPTATYSAADQTTDGLTPGNPVNVQIFQLSAEVGRGFAGVATV